MEGKIKGAKWKEKDQQKKVERTGREGDKRKRCGKSLRRRKKRSFGGKGGDKELNKKRHFLQFTISRCIKGVYALL